MKNYIHHFIIVAYLIYSVSFQYIYAGIFSSIDEVDHIEAMCSSSQIRITKSLQEGIDPEAFSSMLDAEQVQLAQALGQKNDITSSCWHKVINSQCSYDSSPSVLGALLEHPNLKRKSEYIQVLFNHGLLGELEEEGASGFEILLEYITGDLKDESEVLGILDALFVKASIQPVFYLARKKLLEQNGNFLIDHWLDQGFLLAVEFLISCYQHYEIKVLNAQLQEVSLVNDSYRSSIFDSLCLYAERNPQIIAKGRKREDLSKCFFVLLRLIKDEIVSEIRNKRIAVNEVGYLINRLANKVLRHNLMAETEVYELLLADLELLAIAQLDLYLYKTVDFIKSSIMMDLEHRQENLVLHLALCLNNALNLASVDYYDHESNLVHWIRYILNAPDSEKEHLCQLIYELGSGPESPIAMLVSAGYYRVYELLKMDLMQYGYFDESDYQQFSDIDWVIIKQLESRVKRHGAVSLRVGLEKLKEDYNDRLRLNCFDQKDAKHQRFMEVLLKDLDWYLCKCSRKAAKKGEDIYQYAFRKILQKLCCGSYGIANLRRFSHASGYIQLSYLKRPLQKLVQSYQFHNENSWKTADEFFFFLFGDYSYCFSASAQESIKTYLNEIWRS